MFSLKRFTSDPFLSIGSQQTSIQPQLIAIRLCFVHVGFAWFVKHDLIITKR